MTTIKRKIGDSYRKNKDDFGAILFKKYPDFVFKRVERMPTGEIPVFVFHSVQPDYFEAQLQYLAKNQYKTVVADEFYELISGKRKAENKTVLLTFDDGRGSLWSAAYPLLKKYGMRAVCFILPAHIHEEKKRLPNLEDVWGGKADLAEIKRREQTAPLCTWDEIKEMHQSGIVDFQSHTSRHHSVFIDDKIIDFINPSFQISFLASSLYPVVRKDDQDVFLDSLDWGHPIYRSAPAMAAATRYIEREDLSQACINFVKREGGAEFFDQKDWRRQLTAFSNAYLAKHGKSAQFQSADARFVEIRQDLRRSKEMIEDRLGKPVNHLCYPWYVGSETAVRASKEVGYDCNYWGILENGVINRVGVTDPFYIVRMNDDYIFSLPGDGRINLLKLLIKKIFRLIFSKQ